jgi:ABC-type Fe3+/spermidine/putrescine transport system ATPase subunit
MIAVTHDQAEALALSDQIIVMSAGRILQRGRPDDIYRRPSTAEVAHFLGATNSLPARRIDGRLVATGVGPVSVSAPDPSVETARIMFRPSDVVLKFGESAEGWAGRIVFAQYLGRDIQYLIRCGETDITAEVPSQGGILQEGDMVSVGVAPGGLFVYPEAAR